MSQQIVLVTGGNNGIGYSTCEQLVQTATNHVIMGSRSVEKGKVAAKKIQAAHTGASISVVQLDITSDESIQKAVAEVTQQYGRVDTLINNAGVCPEESGRSDFSWALETNCVSSAANTAAFLPLLQKAQAPRVIYVSSATGSIGRTADPNDAMHGAWLKAYRVSKAALNMLVLMERVEYGEKGITVFAFCPGYVISDLAGHREKKEASGTPTPEGAARALKAIHEGKYDAEGNHFLNTDHINNGGPVHAW